VWSPDSRRLALSRIGGGLSELDLVSGKTTVLDDSISASDWSPDGASFIGSKARGGLFALPASGAKPQVLEASALILDSRFSPDGKFLAYASSESGRTEVYVAAYPALAPKRQISTGGGEFPQWRADGKELFYLAANGPVMSVDIRTAPAIEAGVPKVLFVVGRRAHFGVAADGKRFLVADTVDKSPPPAEWMVVLNWNADLKP
jgi:Tol biopolymer transport system component